MVFSNGCQYGIQACMYLASWHEPVYRTVKDISSYLDIPKHFLVKILQQLNEGGIVVSKKGPDGGVALAQSPSEIYLMDIVVAIDGDTLFDQCVLGCGDCDDEDPCSFHQQWVPVRNRLHKELNTTRLIEATRNAKTKFPFIERMDTS